MADSELEPRSLTARCSGPGVAELFADDSRMVSATYAKDSWFDLGTAAIAADRYTSAEFFAREQKHMWPRVWQMAARDDEMPDPGDTVVYENLGKSILLVRQNDRSVRAFWNVCLHRGRKLRTDGGPAIELQCPFHGFTWRLDGTLSQIPCRWDFAHLVDADMALPDVRVGHFAGFIFVNQDPHAQPLEDYLAPLPEHFARWRLEESSTAVWVAKVIPANWKAVAEAFMEAWHSVITHPQILPFTGDANTRYSLWGDHVNLALTPFGVPSPHLGEIAQQDIIDAFAGGAGRNNTEAAAMTLAAGEAARTMLADRNRAAYAALGHDADAATDTELLDAWTYNVFPNLSPWGGFMSNIVYRWRPWPDQDHTLMEVRVLARAPKGAPVPRAVEMVMLGDDEPWSSVTAWGQLGSIFDQDMANLPYVQQGLKSSPNNRVELGAYQESRIRHFHATLDKYLDAAPSP